MTKDSAKKCGVQFPRVFCFTRSVFVPAAFFYFVVFFCLRRRRGFSSSLSRTQPKILDMRRFRCKNDDLMKNRRPHVERLTSSISEYPLSSPGLEEMCNHLFFA